MKKAKTNYFIQDKVLLDSDKDFFRHKDLSKNIANLINNETYNAPYNIALIGKWGLGKSSLLKFIEPQINKDCMIFTINAWKYEKESLKKKFLKNIYEEITKEKISIFDDVLEFVSTLLKKQNTKIIPLKESLKTQPMTDKEVEEMGTILSNTFNTYQENKKNIYQVVSIILMVLGVVGSFILSVGNDNLSMLFIGSAISLVSGLFMYGFGEIIRQLKLANTQLSTIKTKK